MALPDAVAKGLAIMTDGYVVTDLLTGRRGIGASSVGVGFVAVANSVVEVRIGATAPTNGDISGYV
jgi:hypothetical protein